MRVGLLTSRNIASKPIRTAHYIKMALDPFVDVRHLAADSRAVQVSWRRIAIAQRLTRGRYTSRLERRYAKDATADFLRDPVDVVLGIFSSVITPYFDIPRDVPLVHVSDATLPTIYEVEDGYKCVKGSAHDKRMDLERMALQRSDLLLYPSEWAARSAIDDFGVDPSRVHIVEWGGAAEDGKPP